LNVNKIHKAVRVEMLHFVQNDRKNVSNSKVLLLRQRLFTALRVTKGNHDASFLPSLSKLFQSNKQKNL